MQLCKGKKKKLQKSTFHLTFNIFQLKEWSLHVSSSKTEVNDLSLSGAVGSCGETHMRVHTPTPPTQLQIPTSHGRAMNTLCQHFFMAS